MNIKTTLHATAPLLFPCRGYPKCPWGLYASPPPVAMAVVGWFLCFPAFFGKKGFFFPIRDLRQKKKFTRVTPKKKNFRRKKNAIYAKKKVTRFTPKKIKKRLTLISTIELRFPQVQHPAVEILCLCFVLVALDSLQTNSGGGDPVSPLRGIEPLSTEFLPGIFTILLPRTSCRHWVARLQLMRLCFRSQSTQPGR